MLTCTFCLLSYLPGEEEYHSEHCRQAQASYNKIWNDARRKGYITWFRPKKENAGAYHALAELNPRMAGFLHWNGLSPADLHDFQSKKGGVIEVDVAGDGHDRIGEWLTPDKRRFRFSANWRAGMVDFWLTEE